MLTQGSAEKLRPLKRREYERMVEQGYFQDERIELLGGILVAMSPIGPRHVFTVALLTRMLVLALKERAWVSVQGSYALDDLSEPEPDVAVIPPDALDGKKVPGQAWLIIEVAESSLEHDRSKAARYAAAGVPEYWIVNLVDDAIEVYQQPESGRYARMQTARRGDPLPIAMLPDVVLSVDAILPRVE